MGYYRLSEFLDSDALNEIEAFIQNRRMTREGFFKDCFGEPSHKRIAHVKLEESWENYKKNPLLTDVPKPVNKSWYAKIRDFMSTELYNEITSWADKHGMKYMPLFARLFYDFNRKEILTCWYRDRWEAYKKKHDFKL